MHKYYLASSSVSDAGIEQRGEVLLNYQYLCATLVGYADNHSTSMYMLSDPIRGKQQSYFEWHE